MYPFKKHVFPEGFAFVESITHPANQTFSLTLENNYFSQEYKQKYLSVLIIYENLSKYEKAYTHFSENSEGNFVSNEESFISNSSTMKVLRTETLLSTKDNSATLLKSLILTSHAQRKSSQNVQNIRTQSTRANVLLSILLATEANSAESIRLQPKNSPQATRTNDSKSDPSCSDAVPRTQLGRIYFLRVHLDPCSVKNEQNTVCRR